ncbi:MAG: chemotaxis-specific protein-glutamate methyltransferase CheB [Candidatus Omnitrophica bacterium]|nr:chemotaxis-specific protein-glutamate methyltransferase CheB [Candidatus Omnitrophota bacterium]
MECTKTIKVLVVDDSPFARKALSAILNSEPGISVVGTADNGKDAIEKALLLAPDVITMDVRMPGMDGLEALDIIMQNNPVPVIMVSSIDPKVVMKALSFGAMDFVSITQDIDTVAKELIEKVKISSRVKPIHRMKFTSKKKEPVKKTEPVSGFTNIVALGISTGGPQALKVLIDHIPENFPGSMIIVQHISEGFIGGLVEWLKSGNNLDIRVAKTGDELKKGSILFAPDSHHTIVGIDERIAFIDDSNVKTFHIPSIDVMMMSVAKVYRNRAVGVIMTGMGHDGVEGIKAIKDAGGKTLAENEQTSVIYGMNKIAIEKGYINQALPLNEMAEGILKAIT